MKQFLIVLLAIWSLPSVMLGNDLSDADAALLRAADVVILGETHDNPDHHRLQAKVVELLSPRSLVVEMLEPDAAAKLEANPDGFAEDWLSLWGIDYALYKPIFVAHGGPIYGAAVSRDVARATYGDGVAAHFQGDSARFGLDRVLPEGEQAARVQLQFEAHCEAMPLAAMDGMVEVQRLRDATLAASVLEALDGDGAPVVVLTGNGHARKDWGVPAYLARVRPEVKVMSVGQGEDGIAPDGGFDLVFDAPAAERPDPCDMFK